MEKHPWHMSVKERLETAKKLKEFGNKFFTDGLVANAKENYSNGLKIIIPAYGLPQEEQTEVDSLKLLFYLNIAACQMKLEQYENAIKNCTKALSIDGNNIKALYRRAIAFTETNEFEKAKQDVENGLLIEKDNKALKAQFVNIDKKSIEQKQKYQKMLKNCFAEVQSNEAVNKSNKQ